MLHKVDISNSVEVRIHQMPPARDIITGMRNVTYVPTANSEARQNLLSPAHALDPLSPLSPLSLLSHVAFDRCKRHINISEEACADSAPHIQRGAISYTNRCLPLASTDEKKQPRPPRPGSPQNHELPFNLRKVTHAAGAIAHMTFPSGTGRRQIRVRHCSRRNTVVNTLCSSIIITCR